MREKRLATPQCSVILPSRTRITSTVSNWILRPVGAMPKSSPRVRAVVGFVGRHPVAIGKLPVDVCVEVREGSAQNLVELARASLVRRASRLWRMIEKIVGEQFLKHLEIPAALHLLGVPPNNCLRGFTHTELWS